MRVQRIEATRAIPRLLAPAASLSSSDLSRRSCERKMPFPGVRPDLPRVRYETWKNILTRPGRIGRLKGCCVPNGGNCSSERRNGEIMLRQSRRVKRSFCPLHRCEFFFVDDEPTRSTIRHCSILWSKSCSKGLAVINKRLHSKCPSLAVSRTTLPVSSEKHLGQEPRGDGSDQG